MVIKPIITNVKIIWCLQLSWMICILSKNYPIKDPSYFIFIFLCTSNKSFIPSGIHHWNKLRAVHSWLLPPSWYSPRRWFSLHQMRLRSCRLNRHLHTRRPRGRHLPLQTRICRAKMRTMRSWLQGLSKLWTVPLRSKRHTWQWRRLWGWLRL